MVPTSFPELPKPSRTPGKKQKPGFLNPNILRTNKKQVKFLIYLFFALKQYIYIYRDNHVFSLFCLQKIEFYKTGFWLFPGVLEGLGSYGKLVGSISTYPVTYKFSWSRVIAKNPGGVFFSLR